MDPSLRATSIFKIFGGQNMMKHVYTWERSSGSLLTYSLSKKNVFLTVYCLVIFYICENVYSF